MHAPLLRSKLRVPDRRPGVVARPRLAGRLHEAGRSALTVLSAPAGFGKTTLLTEWLAAVRPSGSAAAWVSLDARDSDARLFLTYVVTAVQAALPEVGAAALEALAASAPLETVVASLLNDLSQSSTDLVLVLDDYHLVEAPEVHDAMSVLLEHQPAQLHVVLATRVDPPLPLARLRAGGRLVELRAADLRFTAQESTAYLNDCMHLGLGDGDLGALDARTEGWIAALQLAALSLRGRGDASAFIAGFAGDDRHVVDYLAEEVLAGLAPDVRDFLLQTSVLDRLSGPLCDAVTGQTGGTARLAALERANLFLVPLDGRRQWYRYHHLFADVLRAHLLEERAEVAGLHRRASAWFGDEGDTSSAIDHALAGDDPERAADLVELALPVLRRERREAELERWARALPDALVRVRPVLGVHLAGVLGQVPGGTGAAARLTAVERAVRRADGSWPEQPPPGLTVVDREAYRSLPASIEMFRAALALAEADLAATLAHARSALALVPPGDALTRAAAGALAGLASWTVGDLAGAHAAYTESVAGLRSVGALADVLGCTITLGDIRRTQGRLGDALGTYRQALDLSAPTPGTPPLRGTADMHVAIAGVLLERDDRTAAAEHLAISRQLGEHNGLPQNPYRSRVVLSGLRAAAGDLDGALGLLDEAERVYVGDYSPNVQPVPAVRARLRLRRGELAEADRWAREQQLTADDELSYLHEYEHLTLARVLLAHHREAADPDALTAALALLARLLAAAESGQRGGSVLEVLVLQSLAHAARPDTAAALSTLGFALRLAEPEHHVRLFADEGAAMAALLKALSRTAAARPYVTRLLAATQPTSASRQPLADPLSERELDVLRLLAGDLDGPGIARALFVSVNTMRTHTKSIYSKLGATSRRTAVRRAVELDLLPRRPHA